MKNLKLSCGLLCIGAGLLLNPGVSVLAQGDPALIWSKASGPWAGDMDGNFGAIAAHPTNPNILLAGCSADFGAGIFKSVDGGTTWVAKNSGVASIPILGGYHAITKVLFAPSNPSVVYFSTAAGDGALGEIYKSTDGAESWQRVYSRGGGVYDFDVHPQNAGVVYAGFMGIGVMKTIDGGTSWSTVIPGGSALGSANYYNAVRIIPSQPETVLVSGFTSYDLELPGILWIENLESIPGTTGVIPLALTKSTDGGATWTTLSVPSGPLLTDLQYEPASGNLYACTIS